MTETILCLPWAKVILNGCWPEISMFEASCFTVLTDTCFLWPWCGVRSELNMGLKVEAKNFPTFFNFQEGKCVSMIPGQLSCSSLYSPSCPSLILVLFHLLSACDLLTFTTKRCRNLPLKRKRERGEGWGRGWGGSVVFSGTSGRFPAVSLARRHAASCPERPRHVLPFNQSGRMNGCWSEFAVWEWGWGGEGVNLAKHKRWHRGAWRHHWADRSPLYVWSGSVQALWRGGGFFSARKGRKGSFKHWKSKRVSQFSRERRGVRMEGATGWNSGSFQRSCGWFLLAEITQNWLNIWLKMVIQV